MSTDRHGEAEPVPGQITQPGGDAAAYQYAEIYTQWGDPKSGLDWLEKAMRLHDPGLVYTKVDPLLDLLRGSRGSMAVWKADVTCCRIAAFCRASRAGRDLRHNR